MLTGKSFTRQQKTFLLFYSVLHVLSSSFKGQCAIMKALGIVNLVTFSVLLLLIPCGGAFWFLIAMKSESLANNWPPMRVSIVFGVFAFLNVAIYIVWTAIGGMFFAVMMRRTATKEQIINGTY